MKPKKVANFTGDTFKSHVIVSSTFSSLSWAKIIIKYFQTSVLILEVPLIETY